jgi:hypothetical protein
MIESSKVGMNQTGIDMSPELTEEMIEGSERFPPQDHVGGSAAIREVRLAYIQESGRLGSVPAPATMKGMLTTVKDKVMGNKPEVFIDLLGQRLAFERSGVRLYELFITKCEAMGSTGLFSLDDVRHIQSEEAQHFKLVADVMEHIGADSTAQTPAANACGVASMGLMKVLSDPRTSIAHGLEALLTAELVDNAGWEVLIEIADGLGMSDTANQFRTALAEEGEHLMKVKGWYQQAVLQESGAA